MFMQKIVFAIGILSYLFFQDYLSAQILVKPGGKETSLAIGGLVQVQADFGDRGDGRFTTADDRFYLRRARINAIGRFLEEFDFKLEVDASGSIGNNPTISSNLRVQLTDAYINWNKYAQANIRGGQFKTAYGYEQIYQDPKLYTIERSLPNDRLTLGRQIGVQVNGDFFEKRFSYGTGVFNGNGFNTSANDNDSFLVLGRAQGTIYQKSNAAFSMGGNLFHSEDTDLSQQADLGLPNVLFTGTRFGQGIDSQFRFGALEIWAEYLRVRFTPEESPTFDHFDADGWYTQVSYMVIPQKLMLVGKYETFDPTTRIGGDQTDTWTAGVNYYFKADDIVFRVNYLQSEVPLLETQNKILVRMQVIF
jgi:phosphate-selective porin